MSGNFERIDLGEETFMLTGKRFIEDAEEAKTIAGAWREQSDDLSERSVAGFISKDSKVTYDQMIITARRVAGLRAAAENITDVVNLSENPDSSATDNGIAELLGETPEA